MIFGRRRRLMANQVPAIEAAGILRLMVEKDLVTPGEAAACLRGIANDLVAHGHRGSLGDAGRVYAAKLLERADEMVAAGNTGQATPGAKTPSRVGAAAAARPRLVWRS